LLSLQLGAAEVQTAMPPVFLYWREFSGRYVVALCALPDVEAGRALPPIPPPGRADLDSFASAAPSMTGAEYLTASVLDTLWTDVDAAFRLELSQSKVSVQDFLKRKNPAWNLVGRVHFNLAENRKDEEAPFAFLATYTTRLSAHAKAQHLPLGGRSASMQARRTSRGFCRCCCRCSALRAVPLAQGDGRFRRGLSSAALDTAEAFQLLKDLPLLEAAGDRSRAKRVASESSIAAHDCDRGGKPPSESGRTRLDFRMEVTLDGERLSEAEISSCSQNSNGLHLVRGRWVEVDREKLAKMLDQFRAVEKAAADTGVTFADAMRMLAGANVSDGGLADTAALDWSRMVAGPWFAKTLEDLRHPQALARLKPGDELKTTLRPYQEQGFQWLHFCPCSVWRLPGDDMGLGKTMRFWR
jgi:non-specific serine/threonine protein kinase